MPDDPQVNPLATLVWNENFETGTIASIFPAGTSGGPTLDTTLGAFEGSRSLRCAGNPSWALRGFSNTGIMVMRVYVRLNGFIPSQGIEVISFAGGNFRVGIDNATKKFGFVFGTSQTMSVLSGVTPVVGQWYLFDVRLNFSANPWTFDWQIDGVSQPSGSNAVAAQLTTNVYFGHATGYSVSVDYSYDVPAVSQTAADYPLGPYVAAPVYNFTTSGGIRLGGSVAKSTTRAYTRSGGVILGGTASSSRAKAYVRSGGVVLGGSALTKFLGPTNLTPPVVTGSLVQGQVLTCTPGTWQQSG